jgi:hypothetical protein
MLTQQSEMMRIYQQQQQHHQQQQNQQQSNVTQPQILDASMQQRNQQTQNSSDLESSEIHTIIDEDNGNANENEEAGETSQHQEQLASAASLTSVESKVLKQVKQHLNSER